MVDRCNKCSKVFCKNRGIYGCEDGISYLDAGIINKPKRVEYESESFGISFCDACDILVKISDAICKAGEYINVEDKL